MVQSVMQGMIVRGIVGCVPPDTVNNESDYPWFDAGDIRKVCAMAGIKKRHQAAENVCTSDLCFAAAITLLRQLHWNAESVDAVILLTQTPDYVMPTTACLLQQRLGLSSDCAAFDVGLGCSAYVYGLWLANALISGGGLNRILLLAGETPSKLVDPKDRATALLFGDAGTATALERRDADTSTTAHYIMRTDGSGGNALMVPAGMFRNRVAADANQYCLHMDGMQLFEFTRQRIPVLMQDLMTFASKKPTDYRYFVFHQANEYMIRFLAGRAGISIEQVPLVLDRFGNTGAGSVPLTLAALGPLSSDPQTDCPVMLIGFGVGLSWGAVSIVIPASCMTTCFTYGSDDLTLQSVRQ